MLCLISKDPKGEMNFTGNFLQHWKPRRMVTQPAFAGTQCRKRSARVHSPLSSHSPHIWKQLNKDFASQSSCSSSVLPGPTLTSLLPLMEILRFLPAENQCPKCQKTAIHIHPRICLCKRPPIDPFFFYIQLSFYSLLNKVRLWGETLKRQKPGKLVKRAIYLSSLWCPQEKKIMGDPSRGSAQQCPQGPSPSLLLRLLQKPRASLDCTWPRPSQRNLPCNLPQINVEGWLTALTSAAFRGGELRSSPGRPHFLLSEGSEVAFSI